MRIATIDGRLTVLVGGDGDSDADSGGDADVDGGGLTCVDVARASRGRFGSDPAGGYERWEELRDWAGGLDLDQAEPFDVARLQAPSPTPRQVFAIGLNYRDHAAEAGFALPENLPPTFTKFPTCISAPCVDVVLPSDSVDWEVELVAVVGRRAERVPAERGWDHVAGLCLGQDFSERVVQMAGPVPQFSLGKSYPGFGPTGPWLVTPDELADREDIALTCTVNGEEVQKGRTAQMIFPVAELVARLSAICPLLPGDVIFTGTPSGVGMARTPPRYLRPGDEVVSTAEGIGTLRNRCLPAAPGPAA